jgi:hypothetical protein
MVVVARTAVAVVPSQVQEQEAKALMDSRHQLNGVLTAVVAMAVPDIQVAADQAALRDMEVVARAGMMVVLLVAVVVAVAIEVVVAVVKPLLVAVVADTMIPLTVTALLEHQAQAELQETPPIQNAAQLAKERMDFILQRQVTLD